MNSGTYNHKKIGFLGLGNMGQTILHGLIASKTIHIDNIYVTNRTPGKIKKVQQMYEVKSFENNEELIDQCDVIIVAVKPQDFALALESIDSSFTEDKILISLAAGITISTIQKIIPNLTQIIRVMPNTPAKIGKGVVGYCLSSGASYLSGFVEDILSPLGLVMPVEEGNAFEALTVSCSSGVGFIFEFMLYWQEWLEEHGFEEDVARKMTVQTFLGTSFLASQNEDVPLADLQNKVVSKKGVTFSGLNSMREMEVERSIRYSFEKAVLRDRELGK